MFPYGKSCLRAVTLWHTIVHQDELVHLFGRLRPLLDLFYCLIPIVAEITLEVELLEETLDCNEIEGAIIDNEDTDALHAATRTEIFICEPELQVLAQLSDFLSTVRNQEIVILNLKRKVVQLWYG